jgi:hypothetical protein
MQNFKRQNNKKSKIIPTKSIKLPTPLERLSDIGQARGPQTMRSLPPPTVEHYEMSAS